MAAANPTLLNPFTDSQAIDLALALLLLCAFPETRAMAGDWTNQTVQRFFGSYIYHQRYPTIDGSYSNLLRHPTNRSDEYRREATSGSILLPLLAMVGWALGDDELVQEIGAF